VPDVKAWLWGDYNNDGLPDLVPSRSGLDWMYARRPFRSVA